MHSLNGSCVVFCFFFFYFFFLLLHDIEVTCDLLTKNTDGNTVSACLMDTDSYQFKKGGGIVR